MKRVLGIDRIHAYASLFVPTVCEKAVRYGYAYDIARVYNQYDADVLDGRSLTIWNYLGIAYRVLCSCYRNEYVYKNEVLNQLLVRKYGLCDTVAVSEFGVGGSIADLAMFNGKSKAFEIKSDLDNSRRLGGQLADYQRLFDECWIVVPEKICDEYVRGVGEEVGVIVFSCCGNGRPVLRELRSALPNKIFDIDVMMRSLHASEYRFMTEEAFGSLPQVSAFDMYEACKAQLSLLSTERLRKLFLAAVKRRKSATPHLRDVPRYARQMLLALNASPSKERHLWDIYSNPIIN